jgi:hypothetical protein
MPAPFLPLLTLLTAALPAPEAHLGYRPGADFQLADWQKVASYYRELDAASPRVALSVLGETTEGRPFLVATISSEETINDLQTHREHQRKLADPRLMSGDEEADRIAATSKPVVMITCTIHSTETASTFMAMELAHWLALGEDPKAKELLENVIVLLVPSVNPDGVEKVAKWYEQTKGKPWEGEGLTELYHKYAGHDTNRDWFMLNLAETRLLTRLLYKEWFPTITYDVHQMGSAGARMFVPPFFDPVNPNLHPILTQSIFLIGAHMASDLAIEGKRGVLTSAMYDNWWNGGCRTTPQRHNMVGVLTEAASVKLATPIFLEKRELRGATRGFSDHRVAINFADPWPGGWWRLRDIVDYELVCAKSVLTLASRYRRQFQRNYLEMGRDAIRRGRAEPPYAWVVPARQEDPGRAADLARILHDSGIEVHRAKSDFTADGANYPAGSYLFPAAQPYRPHLKDLMERQEYPDRRGPGGAAEPPYDVAGWTLPLLMGVDAAEVRQGFTSKPPETERLESVARPAGSIENPDAPIYALEDRTNDAFRVLNALLKSGAEVRRLKESVFADGAILPAGTAIVANTSEVRKALEGALPGACVRVRGVAGLPEASRTGAPVLKPPRIGLYQPWQPSMDEGWTRLVLENHGFAYQTLHDADIRAGRLKERVDALILPSVSAKGLREGYAPDESAPDFVGGLGAAGAEAIRGFVKQGGTLVALDEACGYAIEELALDCVDVLEKLPSAQFYAPGSLLAVEYNGESPLARGMPPRGAVFFSRSRAFDVSKVPTARVAARYASRDPLLSGWLLGPEKLAGRPALVELDHGQGRVALFGFPPQFRGQSVGTFRLLFNALLR